MGYHIFLAMDFTDRNSFWGLGYGGLVDDLIAVIKDYETKRSADLGIKLLGIWRNNCLMDLAFVDLGDWDWIGTGLVPNMT